MSSAMLNVRANATNVRPKGISNMPVAMYPGEREEIENLILMVYALTMRKPAVQVADDIDATYSSIYRWMSRRNRPNQRVSIKKNIISEYARHYGDKSPEDVVPEKIVMAVKQGKAVNVPTPVEE
jgi:hypothetical protein